MALIRICPQGSVLDLTFFILYIDDFAKILPHKTNHPIYAEDLAIWSSSPVPLKVAAGHCKQASKFFFYFFV